MITAVRTELLKLRTIASTWIILAIGVILTLGLGCLIGFVPHQNNLEALIYPAQGTPAWYALIFSALGVCVDLALIVGIIAITGEYRHKTITSTFLVEPRRLPLVAAKLIASATNGLALAIAAGLSALILGLALVAGGFGNLSVMFTSYREVLPGIAAASILFAVYGLGLGALLKNQIAALVAGLGFLAIVEPILTGVVPSVGRWMPGQAASALEQVAAHSIKGGSGIFTGNANLITWWEGALVLLAYGVVFALVGVFTTLRSDVT